jgi:hypothetical protein
MDSTTPEFKFLAGTRGLMEAIDRAEKLVLLALDNKWSMGEALEVGFVFLCNIATDPPPELPELRARCVERAKALIGAVEAKAGVPDTKLLTDMTGLVDALDRAEKLIQLAMTNRWSLDEALEGGFIFVLNVSTGTPELRASCVARARALIKTVEQKQ